MLSQMADYIVSTGRSPAFYKSFISINGHANIFLILLWNYFRFAMMDARRVVSGFRSASGSSLTDGDRKTGTKGLIRAPHHCKSIFHLLKKRIWFSSFQK